MARKRNGKRRKYTISRRARSFPAVASCAQRYSRQSRHEELSPSSRPLGDEISAPISPCCHSRVQIFRLVRRISIYPIYDTCIRRPTSRRRRRFAQLNTIRSVLCFSSFFFPLIYFMVSNTWSINVYDAARSPSLYMPLESLND